MRIPLGRLILAATVATTARGASITSPRGPENTASTIPFFVDMYQAPSVRYQQVHSASDFEGQGSPQYLITEISFGGGAFGFNGVIPNVEIRLSTTSSSVDSLSPVFGNNIGPNNTLVFAGSVDWTSGSGSWAYRIPLQTPFLYDWSAGSLLMDVRNYQTIPPPPPFPPQLPPSFAASDLLGDSVSSAWAFDVNSLTASRAPTAGLLTLFTVTGVPEPRSAVLFCVGLGVLFLAVRRRGRRRQRDVGLT
jgi:hypothetical protein